MATSVRRIAARVPMIDRREAPRRQVAVARMTLRKRGKPIATTLLDLSIYGCRLETAEAHQPGEQVSLRLDGGDPIAATVIWCDGDRIGCRFDTPIPGSLMRELTRAYA